MITAFDADVLIYAAAPSHVLGTRVASVLDDDSIVGIGSTLLLVEVLMKPVRAEYIVPDSLASTEIDRLTVFLSRLDLRAFDQRTATMALVLGAKYGLKSVDAAHLATAVVADADYFLTNNRKDFHKQIEEVTIVYPDDL